MIAPLLGLPNLQMPNIYSVESTSLLYKLSTIWECFVKSSARRALSTRKINISVSISVFAQTSQQAYEVFTDIVHPSNIFRIQTTCTKRRSVTKSS